MYLAILGYDVHLYSAACFLVSLEIWFETSPVPDGLSARSRLQKMTYVSEVHFWGRHQKDDEILILLGGSTFIPSQLCVTRLEGRINDSKVNRKQILKIFI